MRYSVAGQLVCPTKGGDRRSAVSSLVFTGERSVDPCFERHRRLSLASLRRARSAIRENPLRTTVASTFMVDNEPEVRILGPMILKTNYAQDHWYTDEASLRGRSRGSPLTIVGSRQRGTPTPTDPRIKRGPTCRPNRPTAESPGASAERPQSSLYSPLIPGTANSAGSSK